MYLFRSWAMGFRVQCISILVEPATFLVTIFIMPVFTSITFLFIFQYTGKLHSLAMYGVIGPVLLSIWATAIYNSGELIEIERFNNTLELLIATPTGSAECALLGSISANTLFSLASLGETIIIAQVGFGVALHIISLLLFVCGIVLLVLSTCASAMIMANLFVLARSIRLFQNTLTYPFYLLAGLSFPLTALPGWLRPFSVLIALSWNGDLLRSAMGLQAYYSPFFSFSLGLLLTALYFICGHVLFMWTEQRVRRTATLGNH